MQQTQVCPDRQVLGYDAQSEHRLRYGFRHWPTFEGEIACLELAIEQAQKQLKSFEEKYTFAEMAAEDLEGQDDEYGQWAGGYTLLQRLHSKVTELQEISYG